MVTNIHERTIHAPLATVGGMIDKLAARDDVLWPADRWPAMRLDRSLEVGAAGGHGFVRYRVEAYEQGRYIRFRFNAPRGFIGTHEFVIEETAPDVVKLRHVIKMRLEGAARLTWPLAIRWLHDALVEDALDRAEASAAKVQVKPREWSLWVKLLRRVAGTSKRRVQARRNVQPTAQNQYRLRERAGR